jgi:large subunit ribosomal protein L17
VQHKNDKYFNSIGNPYPPLIPKDDNNRNLLHNVLLEEARKEMRQMQYLETANNLGKGDEGASSWAAEKESSPEVESSPEEPKK